MGFDAVIFDMDGLLLDTERVSLRANQIACAEIGFEIELDRFRALAGKDHQAVAEILSDWTQTKIERDDYHHRWLAAYDDLTSAGVDLRPNVVEALDMVTRLGMAKAIATTTGKEHAIEKLGKAGLAGRFETIIGFYCVQRRKPAPDPYLAAASALGVAPTKCLAFEDSDTGVRAALAAGMTVVQVPDIAPAAEGRAHLRAEDLLSGVQQGLKLAS